MEMKELTDESVMPFGKYKKTGTQMANIPASYLLWLWEQNKGKKPLGAESEAVQTYILENLNALKKENVKQQAWKDCDATESDIY